MSIKRQRSAARVEGMAAVREKWYVHEFHVLCHDVLLYDILQL